MTSLSSSSPAANGAALSGLAYAVLGFATLSVGDVIIKSMAGDWPPYAVAALRFSIGTLGLSVLLLRSEGRSAFVPVKPWLQVARGFCLAMASLCFFSAIYIMPLAEALAISFLSPILVQIFAGFILGERVKRKVYAISMVALVGVVIILRPNLAELGWAAFLPLLSATFFALLMVANKASAGQGSALSAQVFVAAGCAPILIVVSFAAKLSGVPVLDFSWPSLDVIVRCAIVAVTASVAHWLAYIGTAKAGAAAIAPAIYVQMLVAIIAGWLFFSEIPDRWTLLGAGIIISAGLFLWRDGMRVEKTDRRLEPKRT